MFLKHKPDGFQIELGGQIEHREIFVVKRFGLCGLHRFAIRQVFVQLTMRLDVTLDIHTHEGSKLNEARIDLPATACRSDEARARSNAARTNRSVFDLASTLTLVGLTRVSIGPAISVMDRGCARIVGLRHDACRTRALRRSG